MAQVNVSSTIRKWRNWSTRSVEELAAVGTTFVWSLGLEPSAETTASDQITRRTIRYYISNGVMDPPEGERRLATYNYRHLLQMLYIKSRQKDGERLDEIRESVQGLDTDELERRLIGSLPREVATPLPENPAEFARPVQLGPTLARWAYLTGRRGRWPASRARESLSDLLDEHVSYQQASDEARPVSAPDVEFLERPVLRSQRVSEWSSGPQNQTGRSGVPRHAVHIPIGDEMELTVPADHPLVYDGDGREFILRGIRRMMRSYLRGNWPAGRED